MRRPLDMARAFRTSVSRLRSLICLAALALACAPGRVARAESADSADNAEGNTVSNAAKGDGGWNLRWRHGERLLGHDAELTRVQVVLLEELVLVTEPYTPSYSAEVTAHAGRVVAFDRHDGRFRWARLIPQTSGDQSAYLRTHVTRDRKLVVFETWNAMRALDTEGRVVWVREGAHPGCSAGPMQGNSSEPSRWGDRAVWQDSEMSCTLDLPSGRIIALETPRRRRRPQPARPVVGSPCDLPSGDLPSADLPNRHALGVACDDRGRVDVVARTADSGGMSDAGTESIQLRIAYRR